MTDPGDINTAVSYASRFFAYRSYWYDIEDFSVIAVKGRDCPGVHFTGIWVAAGEPLAHWHAYMTDSAFSAVLIRFADSDDYPDPALEVGYATW
ncbi:hypothetical protein [Nocardia miyunensis]|uniref:hypothetical protein n=1 Tax=Nocardia miyunensis TaxID=282684 RepID=UPI0012F47EE9|nr:hypothetical protein [Nocardia miyunensis]